MMTAAMRMPEAVAAEMTATMMAATMSTAMMPAAVTTTMTASVTATVTAAALAQGRPCQQAGNRHHGNSNDGSQHRILPRSRAIEASEIVGNWNQPDRRKFRRPQRSGLRRSTRRGCDKPSSRFRLLLSLSARIVP